MFNNKLGTILEAIGNRPAIIYMKRAENSGFATEIHADHVRIVVNKIGNNVIIAGIGPTIIPVVVKRFTTTVKNNYYKSKMRDFYGPGEWVPSINGYYKYEKTIKDMLTKNIELPRHLKHLAATKAGQDETGFCQPDEDGEYDCHRDWKYIKKFKHILYIRPHNVLKIEWIKP